MTGKTSRDDDLLVKGCLKGNRSAQKQLYERFSARMMGVCFRYVQNRADAEDVLQEGFIKVYTSLEQYEAKGSLEGWIRRIMVNTAINFLNKNKRLNQQPELEEGRYPVATEQADSVLHRQDILKMMQQLPAGYRTILNLYAIEGYSHKEIGKLLGIAEGTSRSQYARGRKMLQKIHAGYENVQISKPEEGDNEGR